MVKKKVVKKKRDEAVASAGQETHYRDEGADDAEWHGGVPNG